MIYPIKATQAAIKKRIMEHATQNRYKFRINNELLKLVRAAKGFYVRGSGRNEK